MENENPVITAPYVEWSPLPLRDKWSWPGGARLAISFLFHMEFLPLTPPGRMPGLAASAVHRGPYPEYVDVHEVTPHEYGNRVGIFRLIELFDKRGFAASAAVDSVIAERYPAIVEAIKSRGWSVLGHGMIGAQRHSDVVSKEQERDSINENIAALRRAFGGDIRGWVGVEYSESSRTVDLLRNAGLEYVCGWPNDEQPYAMSEDFLCLPVSIHLDDIFAGRQRKVTATEHAEAVIRAVDVMTEEDDSIPRHLVLGLHPWYSGQPFRSKQIRRVLDRIENDPRIWVTSTDAIVDHYRSARESSK